MLGTCLCNDTVELVQVCVKVEHLSLPSVKSRESLGKRTVNSNPFHNVSIFRKYNDRLEVSLHESSVGKGAT